MDIELKPSNYKKLTIDFKNLQQIDVFSIEKFFTKNDNFVTLENKDFTVWNKHKLPLESGENARSYTVETICNGWYQSNSLAIGRAEIDYDSDEFLIEKDEPIANVAVKISIEGITKKKFPKEYNEYASYAYGGGYDKAAFLYELDTTTDANAEQWAGKSNYLNYDEWYNLNRISGSIGVNNYKNNNAWMQPFIKRYTGSRKCASDQDIITSWIVQMIPEQDRTNSMLGYDAPVSSLWKTHIHPVGFAEWTYKTAPAHFTPYRSLMQGSQYYHKFEHYCYNAVDVVRSQLAPTGQYNAPNMFNYSIDRINDFKYLIGIGTPLRVGYMAASRWFYKMQKPNTWEEAFIDGDMFKDLVTHVKVNVTGVIALSSSEKTKYTLDSSNNLIEPASIEGYNTYNIQGSMFITEGIKYEGKTYEEAHIKPLLLKYKEGKYKAKATVSASWCLAHKIGIDSHIALFDINNKFQGTFAVKNMTIRFTDRSFNYELDMLQI